MGKIVNVVLVARETVVRKEPAYFVNLAKVCTQCCTAALCW